VYSTDHLCPPFDSQPNENLFQSSFGVEYSVDDHIYPRPFSPFETVRCYGFEDDLTYRLSHPEYLFKLQYAVPAHTSAWIFDHIFDRLIEIRNANIEVFDPARHAAPAAACQAFVNGAVGTRLPSAERWKEAYERDAEMVQIMKLIKNPSLVKKESLLKVNPCYRTPLRTSRIVMENDMIILQEPIGNNHSASYVKLRLVPQSLREILFIAFHANPIGGHFSSYRTYARLRLRYYWPGMFVFCKELCKKCPGCALANGVVRSSSELLYSFPISAPFHVLHVDGYQTGDLSSFDGHKVHVVGADGMTAYCCIEHVQKANSTTFAKALMRMMLRHGISHTVVLDKDSKFYGTFRETCELLQLNIHTLSGDNHKGMLVERILRFFNRGLKIFTNERASVRCSDESIDLLAYAWNSAPIAGTDLSRSKVAMGREFHFPIDFSVDKHLELISTPNSVKSYAKDQAK
jgi:hypothetical protein